MKRTLALIGLLAIGLALLFEPNEGAVAVLEQSTTSSAAAVTTTSAPPDPGQDTSSTTSTEPNVEADSSTPTTASPSTTTPTEDALQTVVGEAVDSRFGPFQVEITVIDGTIAGIATLSEPEDRRSQRINDEAIPIYTEAALDLQSADFDAISGATVTWQAWGASLASAIDQAGL
jgi:uncharacterized protein with FMN-binding domain